MDACLIAAGQRAEHYEMAAYGTFVAWAQAMGHTETAKLLQMTDPHRLLRLYAVCEIHDCLHQGPSVDRLGQVQLKSRLDRVLAVCLTRE